MELIVVAVVIVVVVAIGRRRAAVQPTAETPAAPEARKGFWVDWSGVSDPGHADGPESIALRYEDVFLDWYDQYQFRAEVNVRLLLVAAETAAKRAPVGSSSFHAALQKGLKEANLVK